MLPVKVTRERLGALLAADTTTLNQAANPLKVRLFMNNIAVNDGTLLANLTEAVFDGYVLVSLPLGPCVAGQDPVTLQQEITLPPPAGGWVYTCTGVTGLPIIIYGFYVTDKNNTILYAAQNFPAPITITASGQVIDLGAIKIQIVLMPMY